MQQANPLAVLTFILIALLSIVSGIVQWAERAISWELAIVMIGVPIFLVILLWITLKRDLRLEIERNERRRFLGDALRRGERSFQTLDGRTYLIRETRDFETPSL